DAGRALPSDPVDEVALGAVHSLKPSCLKTTKDDAFGFLRRVLQVRAFQQHRQTSLDAVCTPVGNGSHDEYVSRDDRRHTASARARSLTGGAVRLDAAHVVSNPPESDLISGIPDPDGKNSPLAGRGEEWRHIHKRVPARNPGRAVDNPFA